jgi:hypothetical protein
VISYTFLLLSKRLVTSGLIYATPLAADTSLPKFSNRESVTAVQLPSFTYYLSHMTAFLTPLPFPFPLPLPASPPYSRNFVLLPGFSGPPANLPFLVCKRDEGLCKTHVRRNIVRMSGNNVLFTPINDRETGAKPT